MRVGLDARLARRGLGISTALRGLASALSDAAEVIWFGDADVAPTDVYEVRPAAAALPGQRHAA